MKEKLSEAAKHLYAYVISSIIFLGLLGIGINIYSSERLFLIINEVFSPTADYIFFGITQLGDGITFAIVALVFLYIKGKNYFPYLLSASIGSLVVSQGLKRLLFYDALRPKAYFEELGINIRLIEWQNTHSYHSFPSGHTISAFAMLGVIATLSKANPLMQLFCAYTAFIIGFSRIYLAQHFPIDVFVGGFAGIAIALLSALALPKQFTNNQN